LDSRNDIFKSIIWDIENGALVKIKKYRYTGEIYYDYGFVVGEKKIDQLELFPYVDVYTLGERVITRQSPDTLEIISRPGNDESKRVVD
jgi:hypothetical protein